VQPRFCPALLDSSWRYLLVPLYEGAPSFMAALERTRELGFGLVGLEPGFVAADGRLLQVDGLFERIGVGT